MIIVNYKNYQTGDGVMNLTRMIEHYLPHAMVAVPSPYISEVVNNSKLRVFAQHADALIGPKTTGHILPQTLKLIGVYGVIINHAENKVSFDEIKKIVVLCHSFDLKTLVCVPNLQMAKKVKLLKPWAIAYEDPVLIGTGKSITAYRSDSVSKFGEMLKGSKIHAICGSGISSREDVLAAKELGCSIGFIASAVAGAKSPGAILKTLRGLD